MNAKRTGAAMMMTAMVMAACGGESASGTSSTGTSTSTTTSSGSTTSGPTCDEAALTANKDQALAVSQKVFLGGAPADGVLSKDFAAHFPSGQPDQDLASFLGFGVTFRKALPDAAFTFTHVIAEGDLVALRYIGTGTHEDELFGVPASHQKLKWEGMVIRRIEGGLVAEEWNAPDSAGLFGQLTGKTGALSPEATDHTGAKGCDPTSVTADEEIALRVSKEAVLQGKNTDTLLDPGFTMHNPNGIPDANLDGFLGFNAGFRAAFPDAAFTFTHTVGEGGLVLLRYTATGTHSAPFFGVDATGKKVAWEGAVIRRIDGGKAIEEWNAPDIAGLMGQLTAP